MTGHDNDHQAKSTNQATVGIWVGFAGHSAGTFWMLSPKTQNFNHGTTFLDKSCSEWGKVEKPTFVPICNEGPDDEDGETVSENNNIYN